jgi:hypothetical protein
VSLHIARLRSYSGTAERFSLGAAAAQLGHERGRLSAACGARAVAVASGVLCCFRPTAALASTSPPTALSLGWLPGSIAPERVA